MTITQNNVSVIDPMPLPRHQQIIPNQAGFFHCWSRCVRRAFLCGHDPVSGNNYDHRRQWILDRLEQLSTCFAIDMYAYAVMSNHLHIVLYVDPARLEDLPDEDIIKRYRTLFHWRKPDAPLKLPKTVPIEELARWRSRLGDVSWFMRCLKEPLARLANSEDGCTGAFWESRFKSKPLLDESALLTCMAYVDLNPIKAGSCQTLADSDYTSIQQRLLALEASDDADTALEPVMSDQSECKRFNLGVAQKTYLDLVQHTAERLIDERKDFKTTTLEAFGLSASGWIKAMKDFMSLFRTAAGSVDAFEAFMQQTDRTRLMDQRGRRILYRM